MLRFSHKNIFVFCKIYLYFNEYRLTKIVAEPVITVVPTQEVIVEKLTEPCETPELQASMY